MMSTMAVKRPSDNLPQKNRILVILCLLFLFTLGFAARLFWIDRAPSGALIDEAHFGYIAYSLLQTGKDEHGVSWPLVFKGFGDQKLPAYGYVLIPFVKFFGLSVTSIRLPSIIAGSLLILLVYFFVRELTHSKRAGLLASAIVATNPWPFFLSRFGYESNLALFFWVIALNGIIRIKRHWGWSVLAASFSALTWYSYIAYRPVTIAVLVAYAVVLWMRDKAVRKNVVRMLILFALLVLPFLSLNPSTANNARLKQIGIFNDKGIIATINENRTFCANSLPLFTCSAFFNKPLMYVHTLTGRFFHTFSPQYLATSGESTEQFLTVAGFGQFFLLLYPFFVWGLVVIVAGRARFGQNNARWLVVFGLLFSPVAAVLAGEPQKVRLSPLLPFIVVCIVVGLLAAWRLARELLGKRYRWVMPGLLAVFSAMYLGMTLQFFVHYFTVHVDKNDHMYQTFVRVLMPYLDEQRLAGSTIYVRPNFSDPAMFYAFYTQMNPATYQKQAVLGGLEDSGFQHTIALDRFFVTDDDLPSVACKVRKTQEPTVYVSNVEYSSILPLKKVTSTNGSLTYNYVYDAVAYSKTLDNCSDR